MKEIKFKGQDVETNEWYYGGIYQIGEEFYIVDGTGRYNLRAVIAETIGQYTGLKDEDGTEMYEGDVVSTIKGEMFIKYLKDSFQCIDRDGCNHRLFDFVYSGCIRVIGNRYENPKLMED